MIQMKLIERTRTERKGDRNELTLDLCMCPAEQMAFYVRDSSALLFVLGTHLCSATNVSKASQPIALSVDVVLVSVAIAIVVVVVRWTKMG